MAKRVKKLHLNRETLRSLGYTSPDRIYSIVETGPSPNGLAGQAVIPPDDRATDNLANTGPWYDIVWQLSASTLMHEQGHNMGAVQNSAPHSTDAGHCYQLNDVMCYNDGGLYFQDGGQMIACNQGQTLADEWDGGAYAQVVAQFARRWFVGLRGDLIGLPSSSVTARTARGALSVTFQGSEFMRVRAYAEVEKGNLSFGDATVVPVVTPDWAPAAFLQLEISIGAHGAHPF